MLRILTFTSLYPSQANPSHGIFVENRLRELLTSGEVEARVVAPVPWAPPGSGLIEEYAQFQKIPRRETRHGIDVIYPRYLLVPKIGMSIAPLLMYLSLRGVIQDIIPSGYDFDLIDAHYFYPDGVAAIMLGRLLNKPVVITARGTDLNLIPQYSGPRRQILWAARHASGMITVCQALKDTLTGLGVDETRVRVLRNGVDLKRFHTFTSDGARDAARAELKIDGLTLLSVGHLIERKGHDLVIGAMPLLPEFRLLIAGGGEENGRLKALAASLKVADRVRFLGPVRPEDMPRLYGACDALILASSREGWANVLLEAMACGTPVVASSVWGTPEVVADPAAGVLMEERTAQGVANGVRSLFSQLPATAQTRAYAERFSWAPTTLGQVTLFKEIQNAGKAS